MHPNLLDQLTVFETIAEKGTFSAAAKKLNRTVSAVGYAVAQLEEQLDLILFDRSSYRPTLTDAGEALLRDAEIITRKIDRFAARAEGLRKQIAINATIMLEPYFPRRPLAAALATFSKKRPQIQLSIQERGSDEIEQAIIDGTADLGLLALRDSMPMRNFDGRQISLREVMLVAAPNHPLAQRNAPFPLSDLDDHRQIILSGDPIDAVRYNYHVHVTDLWATSNVDLMAELVANGAGWAFMAHNLVNEKLKSGELVTLRCKDVPDWAISRFAAVWTPSKKPDEAMTELIDFIQEECRAAEDAISVHSG